MSHHTLNGGRNEAVPPNVDSAARSSDVGHETLTRPPGILLIEDTRLMRQAMEQALQRVGFAVWAAADGAVGVDLYRRYESHIDLVLSDMHMPVMNGLQTLAVLRAINPIVRFCFMSGDTRPSTLRELQRRGALHIFTKPFESLAAVTQELLLLATCPPPHEPSIQDSEPLPEQGQKPRNATSAGSLFGSIVSFLNRRG